MSPFVAGSIGFGIGLVTGIAVTVIIVQRIAAMGRKTRLAMDRQKEAARDAAHWSGWQETDEDKAPDWN